jgi:cytochrome c-type biogenesis protein
MVDITIPIAFVAGILSFLSPCILPLTPAYISYASGKVAKPSRARIFMNALFFVIGFAVVFSLLGVILNSVLGSLAFDTRTILSVVGGIVIAIFGVYLILQVLGVRIPFLGQQHKLQPRRFKSNYLTSFVFGVAFAAGWTPCVGAILGAIFTLAITQPAAAFNLMLAYSFGLGVPFLIAGAFISQFSAFIARFAGFMRYFTLVMGFVLIGLGVLVATGYIGAIALFIPSGLLGGAQ